MAEEKKPKPPTRPAFSRTTKRHIAAANELVKQAKALQPGESLCKGRARQRDAEGNILRDENGVALTRPCKRRPITGGTVCMYHGGSAPQVKKKAAKRLLAMVEPSLVRLEALVNQTDHMPTALGAIRTVLERAGTANAIGALSKDTGERDTRPVINIGLSLGGLDLAKAGIQVNTAMLPAAKAVDAEEGEVAGDDADDQ